MLRGRVVYKTSLLNKLCWNYLCLIVLFILFLMLFYSLYMYILLILLTYYCFKLMLSVFVVSFNANFLPYGTKTTFPLVKIPFKHAKINLFSAMWKCKFCIYTRVCWLCSRPRFLSPQLSFKKEIWMSSIQGGFITWLSVGGGATFTPMKVAQSWFEDKKISTSRLWKHPDHRPSRLTSSLSPG